MSSPDARHAKMPGSATDFIVQTKFHCGYRQSWFELIKNCQIHTHTVLACFVARKSVSARSSASTPNSMILRMFCVLPKIVFSRIRIPSCCRFWTTGFLTEISLIFFGKHWLALLPLPRRPRAPSARASTAWVDRSLYIRYFSHNGSNYLIHVLYNS